MTAATTTASATSGTACAVTWVYTEGVGYSAILPDRRIAYVQPTKTGLWLARIVKRPGQRMRMADVYVLKATADDCMAAAEKHGRVVRRSRRAA